MKDIGTKYIKEFDMRNCDIAELDGFVRHGGGDYWSEMGNWIYGYVDDKITPIPDYFNDLNAIKRAIGKLPFSKKEWLYLVELPRIIGVPINSLVDAWWKIQTPTMLFDATSEQLSQAYLNTFKQLELEE